MSIDFLSIENKQSIIIDCLSSVDCLSISVFATICQKNIKSLNDKNMGMPRLASLVGIQRREKKRVRKLGWHGNLMQDTPYTRRNICINAHALFSQF